MHPSHSPPPRLLEAQKPLTLDTKLILVVIMRLTLLSLSLFLAASQAAAEEMRPYLRAGLGVDMSGDTTFRDGDCASTIPAALFGCVDGDDGKPIGAYGDFGSSIMLEAAAGLELTHFLRVEAAFSYRPGFAFDGNANFLSSGREQPVSGEVNQMGVMGFAYLAPLAAMGVEAKLQPFLGAGLGISRNEIGKMTYDFPERPQPRYSVTPDGSRTDFAWAATAGLSYEVSDELLLDLAWRYSDFGKVETEAGILFNQFSTRTLDIPIGKTEADLTSHSVSLSARWRF